MTVLIRQSRISHDSSALITIFSMTKNDKRVLIEFPFKSNNLEILLLSQVIGGGITGGLIDFRHYGKVVNARKLSKIESKHVFDILTKVRFPFLFHDEKEGMVLIEPNVYVALVIKTFANKTSFGWSNEDYENYPDQLSLACMLTDLICSLPEVNYDGLEMPRYI